MSNFFQPHELQHARFPCPSHSPEVSADSLIKALLSMALPTRARPSFPHSHCLPSGNLHKLYFSIRGQTEETSIIPQPPEQKPQSQKANQNDHMDNSHVELNEAMSHAMQDSRQMGHGGEF